MSETSQLIPSHPRPVFGSGSCFGMRHFCSSDTSGSLHNLERTDLLLFTFLWVPFFYLGLLFNKVQTAAPCYLRRDRKCQRFSQGRTSKGRGKQQQLYHSLSSPSVLRSFADLEKRWSHIMKHISGRTQDREKQRTFK